MIRFLNILSFVLFMGGVILLAGGCETMNFSSICTGGVCLLMGVLLSCAVEKKGAYDERDEYDQK